MKIMLFIRSLGLGGAERQLLILADRLSESHEVTILTFYDQVGYDQSFLRNGKYSLISLSKRGRWDILGFLARFLFVVKRERPDIIYAFMSTASVVSVFSKLLLPRIAVVWGVRSSNMNLNLYGVLPRVFRWLECKMSALSDLVISNSLSGCEQAISDGFLSRNMLVIPNGIDTNYFAYSEMAREQIRCECDIPMDAFVIGTVARHDPMKGLENLLAAASEFLKTKKNVYFLMVGSGTSEYTQNLKNIAKSLEIEYCVRWVGKSSVVKPYYSAMDLFTSSSIFGEGFSNAIGEAMATGLPVVVTDVGDSKKIVGHSGFVVEPNSIDGIVEAWEKLYFMNNEEFRNLKIVSRKNIVANYEVDSMVFATERALTCSMHKKNHKLDERDNA